ncbi:AfsR/SARP family transcriptional regulator [Umezawaea beigongshangensis]|uniref:AfsR/SARP family transcriptional regulator n=1 Tax=Umezawaea beigongshangensis TaxID=2780383 RepID=UPI0018F1D311|nr:BTAD domain-containing putative transcriptional regulator [Umezawaea beigongshangensis]
MEFRVLGPVEVAVEGGPIPVGGPKPRTLLALLAVQAGRVVPAEQLIDAVWGEEPPESARAAVHTYVSALRRALAEDVIVHGTGGYRLDVEHERIDLHVFTREVSAGKRAAAAGRPDRAAAHFRTALQQWRGAALGGARGRWAETERTRLGELRLAALEECVDAELSLGRGGSIVDELASAIAEQPLRERLRAQLVLALHQAGRRADALSAYQEARRVLLDELGLDPGPVLRQAHDHVLTSAPAPRSRPEAVGAPSPAPEARVAARPGQLPFDIADFTGRTVEVAALIRRLSEEATSSRLCAVYGKPGAGKSTLAVHVAHRVRAEFPDGQLYASLRGVRTVRSDPAEVLAGFLRALGVPDTSIPAEPAERAQLYRTVLADRRVLVVLDDAFDERQVRPLLPGGHRCAALVTSRERLGALGGAAQLDLHVLGDAEALQLLDRIVGDGRVAAEPAAAGEIVRLCGHLPLAVRIAGARLAARARWPLQRLADRLVVQHRVLQELTIGDLEVRGSLALSYDELGERERTALRKLGLLDLSSFGGWVLAPLLGCDAHEAEEVVERLVDAQLLDAHAVDVGGPRFQIHDLTRAFARERGEQEETDFREAATRVAECWLALVETAGSRMPHATFDAVTTVDPHLDAQQVDEVLADPAAWFDAEQTGLVGVVERVSELDLADVATRLAAALCSSRFSVRNLFGQWWRTHSAALAAARRAGDRAGEARLLAGLGWLRYEQDRFDEAAAYYEQALELGDDPRFRAMTRLSLSTVQREHGQLARARESLDLALAELSELDEPRAVAQALHGLGRVLTEQGELDAALDACERAALAYEKIGDDRDHAIALRSVGIAHRAAGRLEEAARWCEEAVDLLCRIDDPLMSAYAVQALAKVRVRQGRGDEVRELLVEGLATCNEMQDGFGQALMRRTLGELELAAGNPGEASRHLEHAVQWWNALSLPVWRARTLRDLASAHDALGDAASARATWDEALAIFHLHGSREATEPGRTAHTALKNGLEVSFRP